MIEYLQKIKKDLSMIFLIYHLIISVSAALIIFFILKDKAPIIILNFEAIFIMLSVLVYFSISIIFKRYIEQKLSSQESISSSLFKNSKIIINNVSHEIRTPLNAIMGFTDSLYEIEKDKEKLESLLAIKNNSERLFAVAKKLIDFSTIETGQYTIEREYFDNGSLLMNLENKYSWQINQKKLDLGILNKVPGTYRIFSDYNIVFVILEMLLENAIKFTEKGYIRISSSIQNGKIIYDLCDSGCGVPDDKKGLIFQLFMQGNSDMDRVYEGIGLGLTIADKLAYILGGSIQYMDNDKRGSCFKVILHETFREVETIKTSPSINYISDNLTDSDKEYLQIAAKALSEYVKVFNREEILKISENLKEKNGKFDDICNKLIMAADTYNESEFSKIVGEMLKVIHNED